MLIRKRSTNKSLTIACPIIQFICFGVIISTIYKNEDAVIQYKNLSFIIIESQEYMQPDYSKKLLFGSIDKNKLPNNLTDYNCQFHIQEFADESKQTTNNYLFKFTPKIDTSATPFSIQVDQFLRPKNLIFPYKFSEGNGDPAIHLSVKAQYKMQTSIKLAPKPQSNLESIDQSQSQFYPDEDLELRVLELADSYQSKQSQSDSKCIQPSDYDKGRIMAELIHFFHDQDNKFVKLKEARAFLSTKGYRVAENRIKLIMGEICKPLSDKKSGYVLKDKYIQKDEYQRRNPKKKIKEQ